MLHKVTLTSHYPWHRTANSERQTFPLTGLHCAIHLKFMRAQKTDLDFLLMMVYLPGDVNMHSTPLSRFLEKTKGIQHESVTFKNL